VDHHLSSWLLLSSVELRDGTACRPEHLSLTKFRRKLFDVGSSIVFSPENTRAIFQHPDTHPVLLATTSSPRIFTAYVSALRAHKLSVFLDQNNSAGGLARRIREAARQLFARSVAKGDWGVIAQLTQSAEELQAVDDEWAGEFETLVKLAMQTLDNRWNGAFEYLFCIQVFGVLTILICKDEQARIAMHVCSTLACILRLHVQVIEPFTERLLSGFCDVRLGIFSPDFSTD
jgi:hypothetical protein